MSDKANIEAIEEKRDLWLRQVKKWKTIHWITGISGIALSALSAADLTGQPLLTKTFSVLATICFGIIGFTNPSRHAARYVTGYTLISRAIIKYELGNFSIEQLLAALDDAEVLAHEGNYTEEKNTVFKNPIIKKSEG